MVRFLRHGEEEFLDMGHVGFTSLAAPAVLKGIGRGLLEQFLAQFTEELAAKNLNLPASLLSDEAYFNSIASLLGHTPGLPARLAETLFIVGQFATPKAREILQTALVTAFPHGILDPQASPEGVALRLWLAAPDLLMRAHFEHNVKRRTCLDCFASARARELGAPCLIVDPSKLTDMTRSLSTWFVQHQRGMGITKIHVTANGDNIWFEIRHGRPLACVQTSDQHDTQLFQYHPRKVDLVLYSHLRDEIMIEAGTLEECQLYRAQLGLLFQGNADYFYRTDLFSLDPLWNEGQDALDAASLEALAAIVLRNWEERFANANNDIFIRMCDNGFFDPTRSGILAQVIPRRGSLSHAAFDFYFSGWAKPRTVEIYPPNRLKLEWCGDASLVGTWLMKQLFRVP